MQLSVCSYSRHRAFREGLTLAQFIVSAREQFGLDGVDEPESGEPRTDGTCFD